MGAQIGNDIVIVSVGNLGTASDHVVDGFVPLRFAAPLCRNARNLVTTGARIYHLFLATTLREVGFPGIDST
jgi:cytosine/adenosine deaminase-related metal-dependent hydrolase